MVFWRKSALAGLTLLALCLGIATTATMTQSPRAAQTAEEEMWRSQIARDGISRTIETFRKEISTMTETDAHTTSHALGGAIYAAGGALTSCPTADNGDEFLSSGCYHEYIGRGIAERGTSFITVVRESCSTLPQRDLSLCEHGIGHGLVGYFGYTRLDLRSAIEACSDSVTNNCFRGAFMEHDFRRLIHGNIDAREPDIEQSEPERSKCDDFQDSARDTCIYWEPNWWHSALKNIPQEDRPARMYELCGQWEGRDRRLCYVGVGFTLLYITNADISATRTLCEKVFGDDKALCATGAAARFRTAGIEISKAEQLCLGLAQSDERQCMYAAQGEPWLIEGFRRGIIW